jgi:hypothetical protein
MVANFINPDFFEKRDTESQLAYELRIRPYLHHREDAQAEAEQGHAEFRAAQDARTSGSGVGLISGSPQDRAAALGSRGFGSGREVAANGHLGGQGTGCRRIYAHEIRGNDRQEPGVSPLLRWAQGQDRG